MFFSSYSKNVVLFLYLLFTILLSPLNSYEQVSLQPFAKYLTAEQTINTKTLEWIEAGQAKNGTIKFLIRKDYVKRDGNRIKIWTKRVEKSLIVNKRAYPNGYVLTLTEFDCTERRLRIYGQTQYDFKGNILKTQDTPSGTTWEDVIPESIGENLLNKVCETF